jgi:Squalene-hopene cyclase N-terminal domain
VTSKLWLMLQEAVKILLTSQNSDGGWGAWAGKGSATEMTALALLALGTTHENAEESAIRKGKEWLIKRQNPDGSWPLNQSVKTSSWSTALAMIALSESGQFDERLAKAGSWALEQEGSKPGILANLILALTFQKKAVQLNQDLIGWSWTPNSFSWVEPTSYFLIALKKTKRLLASKALEDRIRQGELMIYDRMCDNGGWNYGNSTVYGDRLWPYPDTTAVALIALQNWQGRKENQLSLRALSEMTKSTDSGLALSWSAICFSLYGQEDSELRKRLVERFAKTKFLGETKAIALGILAMGNGARLFRV